MNTKNNKSRKNSKLKMAKALYELLDTYKLEDITVKMIVSTAHVNRSTFYNNYNNMNDFLSDIVQGSEKHFTDDLYKKGFHEISKELFVSILDHIYSHQKQYSLHYMVTTIDSNWIRDVVYSKLLEKYPNDIAYYHMIGFVDGYNSIIKNWIDNNFNLDIDTMADIILDMYQREIA